MIRLMLMLTLAASMTACIVATDDEDGEERVSSDVAELVVPDAEQVVHEGRCGYMQVPGYDGRFARVPVMCTSEKYIYDGDPELETVQPQAIGPGN